MAEHLMLNAFRSLIKETKKPVLVTFKKNMETIRDNTPPFVEVLEPELKGKIRKFELDHTKSLPIYKHFNIPETDSAVIFEKDKHLKAFYGYRNIRKYIRTLAQKN